jgi:hypothetical protein
MALAAITVTTRAALPAGAAARGGRGGPPGGRAGVPGHVAVPRRGTVGCGLPVQLYLIAVILVTGTMLN